LAILDVDLGTITFGCLATGHRPDTQKNGAETADACHITWEEERAEIVRTLVGELGTSEREALRVAAHIQFNLNQIILDRLPAE
jgi:hypothetical protein